jgi:hypothetical protein
MSLIAFTVQSLCQTVLTTTQNVTEFFFSLLECMLASIGQTELLLFCTAKSDLLLFFWSDDQDLRLSCNCCQPMGQTELSIQLLCEDGSLVHHTVRSVGSRFQLP